ncbi:MAG: hypothetical protein J5824_06310 [Lachnospiraceae bacterium]|nr:hypothetical protein [Lachnospiraceae bacterium]
MGIEVIFKGKNLQKNAVNFREGYFFGDEGQESPTVVSATWRNVEERSEEKED